MSDGLFALATIYRTLYGILGSYITARLAPRRPMLHAMVGAIVGTIMGTVGAVVTWNHTEMGPHWYPLALIATAFPCAWIGGRICEAQIQKN
jgi:O-antigen/teichoic acid export membrane protein